MTQFVGGYQVLDTLGKGGMGVVYKARDVTLGREVAIKQMIGEFIEDRHLQRFQREADAVAQLHHPNIVGIHSVGEHQGLPYLVMDLVPGESLSARLRRGPVDPMEAARITELVADALHHAHEQSILHRDVKPANILMHADDDAPMLTDFGLAKDLSDEKERLTISGQMLGTPSFMSPEQAAGDLDEMGPATDVYGLGATLYMLLTGEPPFKGKTAYNVVKAVITDAPRPPSSVRDSVPKDLEAVCLRCLAKEPSDRYPSAEALAEDLARFQRGEPVATAHPVTRSRTKALLGAVLAVAVVGGGAAAFVASREPAVASAAGLSALSRTSTSLGDDDRLRARASVRHPGCVAAVPYGDDTLLSASGAELVAWDLRERRPKTIWTLPLPGAVRALAAHPSGPRLYVAYEDGGLRLRSLDLTHPDRDHDFDVELPPAERPLLLAREQQVVVAGGAETVAFGLQGKELARAPASATPTALAGGDAGPLALASGTTVTVLDPKTLQPTTTRELAAPVAGLAPRRGGWWVAVEGRARPLHEDLSAGEDLLLKDVRGAPYGLAALPDGRHLLATSKSLQTFGPWRRPPQGAASTGLGADDARALVLSRSGRTAVFVQDKGAQVFSVPAHHPPQRPPNSSLERVGRYLSHPYCEAVDFLDDELAITAGEGGARLWDLRDPTEPRRVGAWETPERLTAMALLPERGLLLTAAHVVRFFDLETFREVAEPVSLPGIADWVVAPRPGGAAASDLWIGCNRSVSRLSLGRRTLTPAATFPPEQRGYLYRLELNHRQDGLVTTWAVPAGEPGLLMELAFDGSPPIFHRFQSADVNVATQWPDGTWRLGFQDGEVREYDAELKTQLREFLRDNPVSAHPGQMRSILRLSDGRWISTSGAERRDDMVVLWSADDRALAATEAVPARESKLSMEDYRLDRAALSPDERRLLIRVNATDHADPLQGAELWTIPDPVPK